MMKPLLALMLLLLHFPSNNASQADIIDELLVQFKAGNSKEIAKNFAASVELIVIDQEDVYSKAQSEQILRDFFLKNPPTKIALIHRLNNNQNFRFAAFSLGTKTGKYRVTVTLNLKKLTNTFLVTELRIEQDKE
jgi:citrate lyase beta subunit